MGDRNLEELLGQVALLSRNLNQSEGTLGLLILLVLVAHGLVWEFMVSAADEDAPPGA